MMNSDEAMTIAYMRDLASRIDKFNDKAIQVATRMARDDTAYLPAGFLEAFQGLNAESTEIRQKVEKLYPPNKASTPMRAAIVEAAKGLEMAFHKSSIIAKEAATILESRRKR
jgi:hypothetical protein